MSGGYDARQVTRQSFAVQGARPVQNRASASGVSARAQIVGGESRGGVEFAGPQTDPGATAGQLGAFFEQALAPQLRRRQHEAMEKGFRTAQAGLGLAEIKESNGGFSRIFGSTPFEQGAKSYYAQTASNEAIRRIAAETDALKKMSPENADKAISDLWSSVMTGDTETDTLIQHGLFESSGPLLQTLAKERYEWQQNTLSDSQVTTWDTASDAFQTVMAANAKLSDPTDANKLTVSSATGTFLANRAMLEGQSDESYKRALFASLTSDLNEGRLYSFNALRGSGVFKVLSEEDQTRVLSRYHTASQRALAVSANKFLPDLMKLRANIELEKVEGGAMGAAAELARINGRIKSDSGTDEDLYDYKDFISTGMDVVKSIAAADRRVQARREQLADMQTRRQWEREDRDADDAQETAAVHAIWGMGDINKGTAEGIEGKRFDTVAMAEVRGGNFTGIVRANKRSGWVSRPVANDLQSNVRAGIGSEYSPAIKQAYGQWQSLYQSSPETAAAYYGNLHPALVTFDTKLRSGLKPQAAWLEAFGDPHRYEERAIPRDRQQAAAEAIDAVFEGMTTSKWNPFTWGGRDNLSPSGRAVYRKALTSRAAQLMVGDPGLSENQFVAQAKAAVDSDGAVERYGAFAWNNGGPTKALNQFVGLQGKEMDDVFTHVVTRELKRSGFSEDPRTVNTQIKRLFNPHTKELTLYVEAYETDGSGSKHAMIPVSAFKGYQQYQMDRLLLTRNGGMNPHVQRKLNDPIKLAAERIRNYRAAHPGE